MCDTFIQKPIKKLFCYARCGFFLIMQLCVCERERERESERARERDQSITVQLHFIFVFICYFNNIK